tara:strand:- start:27 stop:233 length:207 start_codon:yes stop_codon:yes gene_type:complete
MKKDKQNGLRLAIKKAGSQSELARRIGVVPAAVQKWTEVPERRILDVFRATGIKPAVLRPDLKRLMSL